MSPEIVPAVGSVAQALPLMMAALFLGLTVYAGIRDIFTYIIPNWVSVTIVAAFGISALWFAMPFSDLWRHFLSAVIIFTFGVILFRYGAMGGGDVKLLTASALWVGLPGSLLLLLLVSVYGGVLTVIVMVLHRLRRKQSGVPPKANKSEVKVPYGVAVSCGALTLYFGFPYISGGLLRSAAESVAAIWG